MQNSMMQLTVFVFHWECPFWADFVQNVKIVSLRRTLIRRVIDMQNSMMLFTVFVFDRKCPFWVNLVQIVNVQIVSLRWNLIPIIIWICRTQWRCSLFSFYRKRPFWANLVENVKVVSSRLNLVASIQLHWHLDTTNSRFWLVNMLLRKFDTLSKKEMKMIKTQILWRKAAKKCLKSIWKH